MNLILSQDLFGSVKEERRVPNEWEWAIHTMEKSIGSVYMGKIEKVLLWLGNGGICVSLTKILCLSTPPFYLRVASLGRSIHT